MRSAGLLLVGAAALGLAACRGDDRCEEPIASWTGSTELEVAIEDGREYFEHYGSALGWGRFAVAECGRYTLVEGALPNGVGWSKYFGEDGELVAVRAASDQCSKGCCSWVYGEIPECEPSCSLEAACWEDPCQEVPPACE